MLGVWLSHTLLDFFQNPLTLLKTSGSHYTQHNMILKYNATFQHVLTSNLQMWQPVLQPLASDFDARPTPRASAREGLHGQVCYDRNATFG